MRTTFFWIGTVFIAVAVAACAPSPPSPTTRPVVSPLASPQPPTPANGRTPSAAGSPLALATVASTPRVRTSPTITPTLGPPTDTPTPAPGAATLEAAEAVDQALVTFAQAEASGDPQATLQAQQKLVDAANGAASVAEADQTNYGQQLRSALSAAQAGAGGDFDKLKEAHQTLVQLEGPAATPVVLPPLQNQPQTSLTNIAQNLQNAVNEYNQANTSGNRTDLLRAQRDLLDASAAAETATKNSHAPLAQQIQSALTAIHDGLAGDSGKFQIAANDLSNLNSAASPTATITATVTPTPSATVSPTVTATTTPTLTATASPTPSITPSPGH